MDMNTIVKKTNWKSIKKAPGGYKITAKGTASESGEGAEDLKIKYTKTVRLNVFGEPSIKNYIYIKHWESKEWSLYISNSHNTDDMKYISDQVYQKDVEEEKKHLKLAREIFNYEDFMFKS